MKPKVSATHLRNRKAGDDDQFGKRGDRAKIPPDIVADILTASRRRCCICWGLRGDYSEKKGQIAHLDHDPSNNDPDDLAFFCFDDHDEYDSRTSQSKGFTIEEVKKYRAELVEFVARSRPPSYVNQADWRARIESWRRMIVVAERKYKSGKEPGVSFAEIFQRQPGYIELEPYLFPEAIAALKDDRLGRAAKILGMVDGKEFVNPPDDLRSILARELRRIEISADLPSALDSKEKKS